MAEQKSHVISLIVRASLPSCSLIYSTQKLLNSYESLTETIPLSCVLYTVQRCSSHTSNTNKIINMHVVRVPCCAVTSCTKPINLVC